MFYQFDQSLFELDLTAKRIFQQNTKPEIYIFKISASLLTFRFAVTITRYVEYSDEMLNPLSNPWKTKEN